MPEWAKALPPDAFRAAWRRHVEAVVTRYKGRIHEWNAANEVLGGDGEMFATPFLDKLGPSFVPEVFHLAHQLDPDATLILNEHSVEEGGPKTEGLHRLAKRLLDDGLPLGGVGLQGHFSAALPPSRERMEAALRRFDDLGVPVHVTEVDVRIAEIPGTFEERLVKQKRIYYDVTAACASVHNCASITYWGFTDRYSWIDFWWGPDDPLFFFEDYRPKPALTGIRLALQGLPLDEPPEPPCTPSCEGRVCGDDGCGGVCGVCERGDACLDGACVDDGVCAPAPDGWPPALEALYDEGVGCADVPPCSEEADACVEQEAPDGWTRTLTTTASDCHPFVGLYDARARVGNVKTEDAGIVLSGNCAVDRNGTPVGAVYDGVLAVCSVSQPAAGVRAFETGVIDVESGKGKARVPITGLPIPLTGSPACTIEMDVEVRAK